MDKKKDTFLEKLNDHLFCDKESLPVEFDKDEQEIALRIREGFVVWIEKPEQTDTDIVNYIENNLGVSRATAYRDLSRIKILLGNVNNAGKEFQRYTANNMVREGYQEVKNAKKLVDVKRGLAMIRAGESLVKINKLDKDEKRDFRFDEIVPLEFDFTDDVSVIGHEPIKELELLQEKLRKRYGSGKIEDVSFEDVTDGGKGESIPK